MAYKTKSSPLNQFGSFGTLGNTRRQQNMFAGGLSGAMTNAGSLAAQSVQQTKAEVGTTPMNIAAVGTKAAPQYNMVKPGRIRANQATVPTVQPMQPTPINPKAVGNPATVKGVYGQANENTFTRTMAGAQSPVMQLANPNILEDGPQLPPQGVDTSITPALGFENN